MDANELFEPYSKGRKDFQFQDLKWLSLTTANLCGINFAEISLSGTNGVNSGLRRNASLNWTTFKPANLGSANLVRSKMPDGIIHYDRINPQFFQASE
jgi:uncharacterized protein YjbI with pentapeptide repeats